MPVSLTEVATALIGKPLERMVEQYNAHKPYRTVLYLTLVGEHAHKDLRKNTLVLFFFLQDIQHRRCHFVSSKRFGCEWNFATCGSPQLLGFSMTSMQGVWLILKGQEEMELECSLPIKLHKDREDDKNGGFHGITFNGRYRPYGRWMYVYDNPPKLLIEFAAGKGALRCHAFEQTGDDKFLLAGKDHPWYNHGWWSSYSCIHTNEKPVVFWKWSIAPLEMEIAAS